MSGNGPFVPLLQKLSGKPKPPPHALQGWQQFMKVAYEDKIKPIVNEKWAEEVANGAKGHHNAAFRATIMTNMFKELPMDEQVAFKKQAADATLWR
jgi:hypothetical protein